MQMEIDMKDNLKMEKRKEKVLYIMLMETYMMANLKMVK